MTPRRGLAGWSITGATVLLGLVIAGASRAQSPSASEGSESPAHYPVSEFGPKRWTAGSAMGLLGSTPDGTALSMNGHLDYFVTDRVSMGPLLQLALTGDMVQVGLAGQGKYWVTSPASGDRGQLYLQGGMGFVHTDFLLDDTSWLVPLGVGFDYALTPTVDVTSALLVNLTDLHTGFGTGADVMPGFALGVRF